MPTATPRLGLTLPIASESMALGDNQLAENYRIIDDNIGVAAGTSFPLSPFVGKIFRRTDENKTYFWTGSTWIEWGTGGSVVEIPGIVAATINNPNLTTTTSEVLATNVNFSAVQNHRYLIKSTCRLQYDSSVENFVRTALRWNTGTVTGASTLIREFRSFIDGANTTGRAMIGLAEFNYTAANQSINIGQLFRSEVASTLRCGGNTADASEPYQSSLTVYDYGTI